MEGGRTGTLEACESSLRYPLIVQCRPVNQGHFNLKGLIQRIALLFRPTSFDDPLKYRWNAV